MIIQFSLAGTGIRKSLSRWLLPAVLVSFVALQACNGAQGSANNSTEVARLTDEGQNFRRKIIHDGLTRSYELHVPANAGTEQELPLVMVFHGGFGSGKMIANRIGMNRIADKENFLVVYPDGVDRHWNDGRSTTETDADDVSFVALLVEQLKKDYKIDESRIYATGLSNGGYLTQRLACELADRIAAFAPVISTMPVPLDTNCSPARPVSMLMINGKDDPLVPWNGGSLSTGKQMGGKGGMVISVPDTIEFWRSHNSCSGDQEVTTLPDKDPNDGTVVVMTRYENCNGNAEVILLSVEGGGHTWPGAPERPRLKKRVGNTSYDIDASQAIWDFFKRHKL